MQTGGRSVEEDVDAVVEEAVASVEAAAKVEGSIILTVKKVNMVKKKLWQKNHRETERAGYDPANSE